MLLVREQLEERERVLLAPYAVSSALSEGRHHPEPPDPYRTTFQRDRDRVIHSKAFRRSKGKTQVFVAHYGDHYRSRMIHSMEVAQVSRGIARTLGLNEDLAETIAIAHDLGHTPFAHAGQDALNAIMEQHGSHFEHNEQSLRVVEKLEYCYADFVGLNLTYEVRDGLIKHRTTYDNPQLIDHPMSSLEAQVVNLADEIAYQNHDIDDGLRSCILKVEQLDQLPLWRKAQEGIRTDLGEDVWIAMTVTALVKLMIHDVVQMTNERLKTLSINSLSDVYKARDPLVSFSPEVSEMNEALKTFLYTYFYRSPGVFEYNERGAQVIEALFDHFMTHFEEIPLDPRANPEEPRHVLVKDYIAGMTDAFALKIYKRLKI